MYPFTRLILIAAVLLFSLGVLQLALMFPWIWAALALLALYTARKRRALHAFGTARWAELSDLLHLVGGNGLLIGTMRGVPSMRKAIKGLFDPRLPSATAAPEFLRAFRANPPHQQVRLNSAVHTMVVAPTGVGKGVSIVIPHLLTCRDSVVCIDPKGENYSKTGAARRAMGHRVVCLDPFDVVGGTDCFNPLDFISKDSPLAIDDCFELAQALVVRTGQEKEPHWADSAEVWITAMTAFLVNFIPPCPSRSLQGIRSLLTDAAFMQQAIKKMCESKAWGGMLARLGGQLLNYKDKELNSTLTTTNRFLRFLDTMAVAASTEKSTFDPSDLVTGNGKMTVFLVLPPERQRSMEALLRMWIGAMLRACVRGGLQEHHKVHFILDEAASLGHLDSPDDAVDKYRGYGVRLIFLYQSLGQLTKCWPDGADQTLLSNVTSVFFGVIDPDTAKHVSDRLGEATIVVTSGGTGTSYSSQSAQGRCSSSWSTSTNDNWSQKERKLLKPEEVVGLDPRVAITFTPGCPPIAATLCRYYEGGLGGDPGYFRPAIEAFLSAVLWFLLVFVLAGFLGAFITQQKAQSGAQPQWQYEVRPPGRLP